MKDLSHERLLNVILSNTCVNRKRQYDDLRLFVLDLHCNEMWIIAQFTPNREEETYDYKIIDYRLQNTSSDAEMNDWANKHSWDN